MGKRDRVDEKDFPEASGRALAMVAGWMNLEPSVALGREEEASDVLPRRTPLCVS